MSSLSLQLKAIDFFCGAGGMSYGFQKAGVQVIAGVDIENGCQKTYESNITNSKFIHADIKNLTFTDLESRISIDRWDDALIFIGCSPCQFWTKIRTVKNKAENSKNLLIDFQKFVKYYRPGFVVVENVPGIYTQKNSPLIDFLSFLERYHYKYDYSIVNASHFGVPQTRKRFLLVATRVRGKKVGIPHGAPERISTVRDFIGGDKGFPALVAGSVDMTGSLHSTASLSSKNLQRLQQTPHDGGKRLVYVNNKRLSVPSQYKNSDSFTDTYGRMSWDKPAPTITTRFISLSNGRFGHPDQDRALSLREGATLQTFDESCKFFGTGINSIARQIGNAVPPLLAQQVAQSIIETCQME